MLDDYAAAEDPLPRVQRRIVIVAICARPKWSSDVDVAGNARSHNRSRAIVAALLRRTAQFAGTGCWHCGGDRSPPAELQGSRGGQSAERLIVQAWQARNTAVKDKNSVRNSICVRVVVVEGATARRGVHCGDI
jgi:hypothetical protein